MFLQAVNSLKAERVRVCLFVHESILISSNVWICAQSPAPSKNSFVTEEVFFLVKIALLLLRLYLKSRPEETLRAQTQFLRGLET